MTGRVVAFTSPLGGTGQTSLVANMAVALVQRGLPCLCIDLCHQNAVGSHFETERSDAGWAASLAADQWWANAMRTSVHGVELLPYGTADSLASPVWESNDSWLAERLAELDIGMGWVLLDAPCWPHPLARQALRTAGSAIVALDVSARGASANSLVREIAEQVGPTRPSAVVATRFDPRRASQRPAYLKMRDQYGSGLAPYPVHADESVAQALADSTCVVQAAPHSQAAHDIQGLTTWVADGMHAGAGGAP